MTKTEGSSPYDKLYLLFYIGICRWTDDWAYKEHKGFGGCQTPYDLFA